MTSENTRLRNRLKKLVLQYPEAEDILLFGSAVRGKTKPNDIDIMILFKTKVNKKAEYDIRKELEKEYSNLSITSKTGDSALDSSFDARESVLFEARSLISGKNIAETYGFASLGLFKYSFKSWNNLKKTKFYHALNGRDGKTGVLQMLNCIKLSDGLILSPLDKIEQMKEFLESWQIEYIYIPVMLPERMNKEKILQQ